MSAAPDLTYLYTLLVVCATALAGRGQLECDGTRSETRFRLSVKRTSRFKSSGASVQSTTGSRGVRISGSNAGYTVFRGSVKGTGYPLHSLVPLHFPTRASTCVITLQLEPNLEFASCFLTCRRLFEGI